jgi:hypothetical protein
MPFRSDDGGSTGGLVTARQSPARLVVALSVGAVLAVFLLSGSVPDLFKAGRHVNQGDVIVGGHASSTTAVKVALNFVVPFVVSNLGVLAVRR